MAKSALTTTSYLMLGMLRLGARSGYTIKKMADMSTHYFWPVSRAGVYPELGRLEAAELVTRRSDPQGGRDRAAYTLNDEGLEALTDWLRDYVPAEDMMQVKDMGILRLFFADALDVDGQLDLIRKLRTRAQNAVDNARQILAPISDEPTLDGTITAFPALTALLAHDTYSCQVEWFNKLEELVKRNAAGHDADTALAELAS